MAVFPDRYESPQTVLTRTPDGKDMAILTGYAVFNEGFKGRSTTEWRRDEVFVVPPAPRAPAWATLDEVAAVVVPSAIYNRGRAVDAGWAIDSCRPALREDGLLSLICQIAVRDTDGYIFRLAYQATVIGRRR